MKKFILALLFAGVCVAATAQKRYTIKPSHTVYGKAPFGIGTTFDIYQYNFSKDTAIIKWGLISNNMVKGWDYSPCAFGICFYTFFADSLCPMNPIPPGEDGFLAVTVYPNGVKGTGTVTLFLYDVIDPSHPDTVTFVINADVANGIHDYASDDGLTIYPNPATESFTVKVDKPGVSNASIQIVDVLGNAVYSSSINPTDSNVIDVNSFSKGIYFVRYDYGNGIIATKKLQIIN